MKISEDHPAAGPRSGPDGAVTDGRRAPLESVIITDELARRESRAPDYEAENRALTSLMHEMAGSSPNVLQKLVDVTLSLCRAHSAGISILENHVAQSVFRWYAVAGQWAAYLGGTMARESSPCGAVLDQNRPLLVAHPERHYQYAAEVTLPIVEALLVPFRIAGNPVGTLWVIAHTEERKFQREDERLLSSLANYASTVYQVISSQQALRAADRAKDEFLAMLGHELRNPLGALASAARVLDSPGDATRARDVIIRQTGHLTRLVDDLLDVSRLTMGKVRLSRRVIDLADAGQRVVDALRARGALDRHRVTFEGPPVWVEADETRIEQIIANLVGNALKFTPPGGTIQVTVRRAGGDAALVVNDSGIGMSADTLRRIFDLFFQGERTLERPQGGLGLGLTLVRRLAELHGGSVHASSEGAGRGSTFTVLLPAVAAPVPDALEPVPKGPGPGPPRRVLIIEDNEDAREMLRIALRQEGHAVHEAVDGPSGYAAATALRPDVALIDVGLSGFDGYEVARRIRERAEGRGIYLVALTGYGQPDDRRRAEEAGFDEHVVKPVDPERVASILARARR